MSRRADAITARIAAVKKRLLAGGALREVQWGVPGPRIRGNVRGQRNFAYTPVFAFIEQRPALDRDRITTDRADDTVLTILDELAITDADVFQFGDPIHVYRIKAVKGLLKNETTGVRFSSEVTVIR